MKQGGWLATGRIRGAILVANLLVCVAGIWLAMSSFKAYRGPPDQTPDPDRALELPPVTGTVRLLAVGDTGTSDGRQGEVARGMARAVRRVGGIHAGLLLGDNFYRSGVSSLDDSKWRTAFDVRFGSPELLRVPFFAALGNHDYMGRPDVQIRASGRLGGRWRMPDHYYRQDFGPAGDPIVSVLVIDTNPTFSMRGAQLAWLESTLTELRRAGRWTLVCAHHPIHSYSKNPVEPYLVTHLLPVFEREPPTLYLAGHDHCMQIIRVDSLTCAIIGSGGKRLYDVRAGPGTLFHAREYGFGILHASRRRIVLELCNAIGERVAVWCRRSG